MTEIFKRKLLKQAYTLHNKAFQLEKTLKKNLPDSVSWMAVCGAVNQAAIAVEKLRAELEIK